MKSKSQAAVLLTLGAALSGIIGLAKPAHAGFCLDVWNPHCDIIPDEITSREIAPMTSFDVYLHNKTGKTIWVAARYYKDVPDRTDSPLGGGGVSDTHEWEAAGYWKVSPYEKILILYQRDDVVGRNIYFHAHSQDGSTWGSSNRKYTVRGREQPFFRADMGGSFSEYTQGFR